MKEFFIGIWNIICTPYIWINLIVLLMLVGFTYLKVGDDQ